MTHCSPMGVQCATGLTMSSASCTEVATVGGATSPTTSTACPATVGVAACPAWPARCAPAVLAGFAMPLCTGVPAQHCLQIVQRRLVLHVAISCTKPGSSICPGNQNRPRAPARPNCDNDSVRRCEISCTPWDERGDSETMSNVCASGHSDHLLQGTNGFPALCHIGRAWVSSVQPD